MKFRYKKFCMPVPIFFMLIILSAAAVAQETSDLKQTLFSEVEHLLAKVQAEQASIVSPTNFRNALNSYKQAQNYFKDGRELKDIRGKLSETRGHLDKCLLTARSGKVTFLTTLRARDDALKANAPEYATRLFEEAEKEFLSAAKKLERNDIKGVKQKVPELVRLFRSAELNAIKVSIIGSVRNLMEEARENEAHRYTPITYANAQKLLNEAEAILNSDRRSESNAQGRAEAAEMEAKHAIFLTREIKRLKKNDKEWENFIVEKEVLIEKIAHELGFQPAFDQGMDKPLQSIARIANALQKEKHSLLEEVEEKNQELTTMRQELQKYREKEEGLQAELADKQYKLEMKRRREELVQSVETIFSTDEAVVLRKGNDIIIRLIGLTFPSGKETIRPEFYGLLATVQRAIRKFPSQRITIEGHTDSVGDDRYNENLSYKRAIAVKQYLIANMGIDETRITALGYGETRPVASNENSAGRAQNRRIDLVIVFGEEVL